MKNKKIPYKEKYKVVTEYFLGDNSNAGNEFDIDLDYTPNLSFRTKILIIFSLNMKLIKDFNICIFEINIKKGKWFVKFINDAYNIIKEKQNKMDFKMDIFENINNIISNDEYNVKNKMIDELIQYTFKNSKDNITTAISSIKLEKNCKLPCLLNFISEVKHLMD